MLTTAEMTLRNGGAGELVRKVRMRFEDVMTSAFVGEVERLTGRTVVAYHSQVVLEPPSCFEIFVLDPTQEGIGAPEQAGGAVEAGDLQEPGQVGDVDQLPSPGERPAPRERAPADAPQPAGGAARAAISNAVMRLTNELYGRGAARTRTFVTDEHVFCAMEGVLTAVERTLADAGETDLVRELRTRFMQMVRPVFAAEVASAARAPGAGHGVPARLRPGHAVPHLRPRRRARARADGRRRRDRRGQRPLTAGAAHGAAIIPLRSYGDALARDRWPRGWER